MKRAEAVFHGRRDRERQPLFVWPRTEHGGRRAASGIWTLAIIARGDAGDLPEVPIIGRQAGKADPLRDFRNRKIGFRQIALAFLNALEQNVLGHGEIVFRGEGVRNGRFAEQERPRAAASAIMPMAVRNSR